MLRHGPKAPHSLKPNLRPALSCRVTWPARWYSTEPTSANDVAILGGGITGLACAYYLLRELPQSRITIYEASDRLGGWLTARRVPVKDGDVLFEAGPRTLRPSSNGALAAQMMQELDLAKDAIFPQNTSPAARNRYLYYTDHLVRMPHPAFGILHNVQQMLSEPAFKGVLWASATEWLKKKRDESVKDESVGDFFARRLDQGVVDRLLSGVLHGIYAGDVWQLSAKSLFPRQWRDEEQSGSVLVGAFNSGRRGLEMTRREMEHLKSMKDYKWDPLLANTLKTTTVFTFRDGLGMLSDALIRHLSSTGRVDFQTSSPVESISKPRNEDKMEIKLANQDALKHHAYAISTLSPKQLNAVSQPASISLIPHIPTVTVLTVNLYYRTPDLSPAGFGYLIPQATPFEQNPERALGVIFDTAYSPSPEDIDMKNWQITDPNQLKEARENGRMINVNDFAWYNLPSPPNIQDHVAKRGSKFTVMLGGHYWDEWPAYPDEQEGLSMAKAILERHLGIKEEPEVWQVNLQRDCIPQYTVGHEERLKAAHRNLQREFQGRLRVAGSWISGVGVNDCLRSALDVVRGMKSGSDGTGLEHVGDDDYVRVKPVRPGEAPEESS